jgi:hypothetical protein
MWYKPMYTFLKDSVTRFSTSGFFMNHFQPRLLRGILLAPLLQKFSKRICGGENTPQNPDPYPDSLEMLVRIRIGSTTLFRRIHFFQNI